MHLTDSCAGRDPLCLEPVPTDEEYQRRQNGQVWLLLRALGLSDAEWLELVRQEARACA